MLGDDKCVGMGCARVLGAAVVTSVAADVQVGGLGILGDFAHATRRTSPPR